MSITTLTDTVQVFLPTETRTLTLDQYAKHKRDGAFDAVMKTGAVAGEKTALDNALAAKATADAAAAK